MPKVAGRMFFNGTNERLNRLGLRRLWTGLEIFLVASSCA